MPRLLIGNFDFEHRLATGDQQSPAGLRRIVAEIACCWGVAAEEGDFLWCPEPIDVSFLEQLVDLGLPPVRVVSRVQDVPAQLTLTPWGWTDSVISLGRSFDAHLDAPSPDAVRRLNSRRFSHELEQARGVALPGAMLVTSVGELMTAIQQLPSGCHGWVVKAEFSNSSRERFVHGSERAFDAEALQLWAQRRLAQRQALFLEPWVERVDEIGVQMTVPRRGEPRVEGVTRLLVDSAGRFRGCEFTPAIDNDPIWSEAVAVGLEVADVAQRAGYFGPLGIDAMQYRLANGEERLRPVQDVNARWTMGRLSLGLRRLLKCSEGTNSRTPSEHGVFHIRPELAVHVSHDASQSQQT